MLSWGEPGAFWFGLLLAPVIIFYFLRMRFRRQPVSSIYIWSRLKMAGRGGKRLRWWSLLLLIIQVSAVSAAVMTLAFPAWVSQRVAEPGMVYILDVSASMAATDLKGSRLEAAKALLIERINNLPANTTALIYLAGAETKPLGAPTEDRKELLSRIETIKCSSGSFNEEEAAKALKTWLLTEDRLWRGLLVTDGGLDLQGKKIAAVFNGLLEIETVGAHGENLGVSGLRVLPDGSYRFLARNGWLTEREITVCLEWEGEQISRNTLRVPCGLSLQTPKIDKGFGGLRIGGYRLVLEENNDVFPLDDEVFFVVNPERKVRVLLAGEANPFLSAALNDQGVVVEKVPNLSMPDTRVKYDQWDLVIADQVGIPPGINTNLLTFGALPPDAPVAFGPEVSGNLTAVDSAHPLLRFVDWQSTRVFSGRSFITDGSAQQLATVGAEPVMVAWEKEGRRFIACGATLFTSELGLSGSFPIFLHNILKQSLPQMDNPLAYTLSAGQSATFAEPLSWRIREKNGLDVERNGRYVTIVSDLPGIYHWETDEGVNGLLAMNVSSDELDITPRVLPISKSEIQLGVEYSKKRHALVEWPLLVLLISLSLEWFLWRKGWLKAVKQS